MASQLNPDDCLLVGRDGVDYRVSYEDLAAQMKVDIGKSLLYEASLQTQREISALKRELADAKAELEERREEEED